jgi:hypothetical protein
LRFGIQALQDSFGIDERYRSEPSLKVSLLEVLVGARFEIGQRKEMADALAVFFGEPDLIALQDSIDEEICVMGIEN